jgi:hypothetical protein
VPPRRARRRHPTRRRRRAGRRLGGCTFVEQPDRRGDAALLFWRCELLPDLVRLIPLADTADSALRFEPLSWPGQVACRATADGLHVVITAPHGREHRLLLPGPHVPAPGAPLGLAIDAHALHDPRRIAAAQRFVDFVTGAAPSSVNGKRIIAPEEAIRRAHMLWALDLDGDGASEHELGAALFGLDVAGATWSNHADRSEVRRLLASARSNVTGGYRRLLG